MTILFIAVPVVLVAVVVLLLQFTQSGYLMTVPIPNYLAEKQKSARCRLPVH